MPTKENLNIEFLGNSKREEEVLSKSEIEEFIVTEKTKASEKLLFII